MRSEQRKHDRFIPRDNAYAALGRKYAEVGKIKDIGLAGLAFEYIVTEEYYKGGSEIDIFLVGVEFHLYRVPCKVIYNIDVSEHHVDNKFYNPLTIKRCGVKFKELEKDLMHLLKFFIQHYTTGKVNK